MTGEWTMYAGAGMRPNPPPALAGVWAKVERAREHATALAAGVDTYLATPPWFVTKSRAGGRVTLRAQVIQDPPLALGVILGDLVHDLRSALDHLAAAFAATTRSVTAGDDEHTQYLILDTAPPGALGTHRRLEHVPAEVVAIMEAIQPYQAEHTIGGQVGRGLQALQRLSNRDKHRVLLLTAGLVEPDYVESWTAKGQESGVQFAMDHAAGRWAEISHPTTGPYRPHWGGQVTIQEPGLPWRSEVRGLAASLQRNTEATIAAYTGLWSLLREAGRDA